MIFSLSITWALVGLILIVLSWVEQIIYSCKHKKQISALFVGLYLLGVTFLVLDGFINNNLTIALFNLATFILS